jgi:hypothetical protein
MSGCSLEGCFAPDTTCDQGLLNPNECPMWRATHSAPTAGDGFAGDQIILPWSGRAMGISDLGFLAGRRKPFLTGVVGSHNAGKTTLLASWYLLLSRGAACLTDRAFAGTYTFDGWEAVANAMRWAPGAMPTFPAHTTSREGRGPGLLHLSFRNKTGELLDFLFADAPGEWFQKWAMNSNSVEAEGARWVSSHADLFLIIADCEALSGEGMGRARSAFQFQTRRLAAERGDRPVALVWTKSDITVSAEMEGSIRKIAGDHISDLTEFKVSVSSSTDTANGAGQGISEMLDWIVHVRRRPVLLPRTQAITTDPLFVSGVDR